MRMTVLAMVCAALAGCATTAKYDAQLNRWIGASEEALIASWGVPDKEYRLDNGKKAIEFVRSSTVQTGGYTYTVPQTTYQSGTIGNQKYKGTAVGYVSQTEPVRDYQLTCRTSFVIDGSGKVESWHHEGNDCVAP